jgi:hypothetical protein
MDFPSEPVVSTVASPNTRQSPRTSSLQNQPMKLKLKDSSDYLSIEGKNTAVYPSRPPASEKNHRLDQRGVGCEVKVKETRMSATSSGKAGHSNTAQTSDVFSAHHFIFDNPKKGISHTYRALTQAKM